MMTLAVQSTSALTFNVVGHLKTFFIIGGGVLFFGDFISVQKALSLILAFTGIGWYSYLKLNMSVCPSSGSQTCVRGLSDGASR